MKDWLGKRLVLITGKGGVGRSTLSAALSHAAQRAGKRVLLTEVGDGGDDYSPLAQRFGMNQLPRKAAVIAPGIQGSQLLSDTGIELFLISVLRSSLLARTALGFEPLRRLFSAAPSLREMGTFFHLLTYLRAELSHGKPLYELIVIDMPATGHTLALTGLPDVVLRLVTRGPIADGLREGQSYLHDPLKTSAYVVTLPETLPISEALELLDGLAKTRVPRGGVIVNRMPAERFSADETTALHGFLQSQPLFGAEAFERIQQARAAVARLREATATPVSEVPEFEESDGALIEKLAGVL
jgi:arsenite-transporting ATPase